MTTSNSSSQAFVEDLGEEGHGVGVAQVTPHPWSIGTPAMRELQRLSKDKPGTELSYSSVEGFSSVGGAGGRVTPSGIRSDPKRDSSRHWKHESYDLGGFAVNYGPDNHTGSNFVDVTVIARDGKFLR
jgi:branched-chain amino acid transport system substrate-binding protein